MRKQTRLILLLTSSLALFAGCSNSNKDVELGNISEQSDNYTTNQDKNLNNKLDFNLEGKNIYDDDIDNLSLGNDVNESEVKDEDIEKAKAYFVADSNDGKFVTKDIDYVKDDYEGLINNYHKLISLDKNASMNVDIENDGETILLDFTSFNPTSYIEDNSNFRDLYMVDEESYDLTEEGILKVLEGYYRTIKDNVPNNEYVYFKLGGDPWEVIKNETHEGLLFLEEGQDKPSKIPFNLYSNNTEGLSKGGFSDNYSGNRTIEGSNESVITDGSETRGLDKTEKKILNENSSKDDDDVKIKEDELDDFLENQEDFGIKKAEFTEEELEGGE